MLRLGYGGLLYLGASKALLARLQRVQNRALRICMCSDRYTSNLKLHLGAKVLPLYLRRKLEIYKTMYSRMLRAERNNNATPEISLEKDRNARPLTRYQALRPPPLEMPNSVRFQNCVTYQGPKLWADLPSSLKTLNDSSKFETEIRHMIQAELATITSI